MIYNYTINSNYLKKDIIINKILIYNKLLLIYYYYIPSWFKDLLTLFLYNIYNIMQVYLFTYVGSYLNLVFIDN